ncbi:hypothetical protein T484DRAFT_1824377 [Baffinella frigidus]|nr:hypothetical protein T484DRAFT_1824377 [Cryptophyta sp. CCMP2293]
MSESGRAGRDGEKATSLLYYAKEDSSLMQFLLNKDKEKPGGGEAKGDGQGGANSESLGALIDICEKAACRRRGILNFFGDKEGVCQKGCDFCKDPKGVSNKVSILHDGGGGGGSYGGAYGGKRKKRAGDSSDEGDTINGPASADEEKIEEGPGGGATTPFDHKAVARHCVSSGEKNAQRRRLMNKTHGDSDEEEQGGFVYCWDGSAPGVPRHCLASGEKNA